MAKKKKSKIKKSRKVNKSRKVKKTKKSRLASEFIQIVSAKSLVLLPKSKGGPLDF